MFCLKFSVNIIILVCIVHHFLRLSLSDAYGLWLYSEWKSDYFWGNKWYVLFLRMIPASVAAAHSIPPRTLTQLAQKWLEEDTPNFDPAGVCVGLHEVEAKLLCKTPHSILAGSPFFTAVFSELGCTVHWILQEGSEIGKYCTLCSKALNLDIFQWRFPCMFTPNDTFVKYTTTKYDYWLFWKSTPYTTHCYSHE